MKDRKRGKKQGHCKNCLKWLWIQARGLCYTCWLKPEIRAKHKPGRPFKAELADISEEELNRMIAEQRANLPPWWDRESRKLRAGRDK